MASFQTMKNGKVRAYVCINGKRDSNTFPNKQKAKSWARDREYELSKQADGIDDSTTLGDLLKRYAKEISPTKKGGHWEFIRLQKFQRDDDICNLKLVELKREHFEDWIAERLRHVKSSTVNRELNLISHCLTQARRWRLMAHEPLKDLKRPKNPPPRFRRISAHEIQQLCIVLGYREDIEIKLKRQFVAVAFLFAIETAMRAGEICMLTKLLINTDAAVAHLPDTKNSYPRDVPLSPKAIELLEKLPEPEHDDAPLFQLTAQTLDANFRKYSKQTAIEDLHFHDTRHEAITRLADKLDVLDLARVTGHRDIRQLLTYYNKSAEELARQLAGR